MPVRLTQSWDRTIAGQKSSETPKSLCYTPLNSPGLWTFRVHEASIALSILDTACTYVGNGSLKSIRLAVGELSAVEPELLRFAWEAVTQGSCHQGSSLEIDWCPARQFCSNCGVEKDRIKAGWELYCDVCRRPLEIRGGRELDLLEISYIEEENSRP